jgi:hypothetical protein
MLHGAVKQHQVLYPMNISTSASQSIAPMPAPASQISLNLDSFHPQILFGRRE